MAYRIEIPAFLNIDGKMSNVTLVVSFESEDEAVSFLQKYTEPPEELRINISKFQWTPPADEPKTP